MAQLQMMEGGGSGKEIVMNVEEMHEIMRYITSLEVSFQTVLAPKLQALSELKYYKGGEAAKAMKHYPEMLNKVNEVSDLYSRANSEIYNLVQHWLQQDALLAQDFQNSLTPDSQLTKDLQILYGGGQQ